MKNVFGVLRILLLFLSFVLLIIFASGCGRRVNIVVPHQSLLTIRENDNLLVGGFTRSKEIKEIDYCLKNKQGLAVPYTSVLTDTKGFFNIRIPINLTYGKYTLSVKPHEGRWSRNVDINVSAPPRFYQGNNEVPYDGSKYLVTLEKDLDIEIRDADADLSYIRVEDKIIYSKYNALDFKSSKFSKKTPVIKKLTISRNDNMPGFAQITITTKDSKQPSITLTTSVPGQIKIEAKDKYNKPTKVKDEYDKPLDNPFELIVDIPNIDTFF